MNTKILGNIGEDIALAYLKKQRGYTVLCRNYRLRTGEIDIIAAHNRTLVFIEVKTRNSLQCGHPAEAVSPHKQKQIIRTAEMYLSAHNITDMPCRFDIIEIFPRISPPRQVHHIIHAFLPSS